MACCNDSTTNCDTGTSTNESLSISLNTRDSRKKTIATTEAGNQWGKNLRSRQIEIQAEGRHFCQWQRPVTSADNTSTLCAFALRDDDDDQNFQFVRSNSDQDGLELSTPRPLPNRINANDRRLFNLVTNFKSDDSREILHHCQSNKFVAVNDDDEIVLHCKEENAGHTYINDQDSHSDSD